MGQRCRPQSFGEVQRGNPQPRRWLDSCELQELLLLRAAAAAHNISTEAERGTGYCFLLLRLRYFYCCFLWVYSIAVAAFEKGCMPGKTNKKSYFFIFMVACAVAALHSSTEMC